ncbi:uncharacterized protein LOC105701510 [Orussus abietinus]|uniref:uncharacterized protein LOC105701510 n=1 Tax=Orussus abietinus TaxID=222816 RepID=UPI0006250D88|nr:uncharacterized protein LOC105701510 [Orussus abietinus]
MRTASAVCACAVFWIASAASRSADDYYQGSRLSTEYDGRKTDDASTTTTLDFFKVRRKRDGVVEERVDLLPARRPKHRRRGRCKNEASCGGLRKNSKKSQQLQGSHEESSGRAAPSRASEDPPRGGVDADEVPDRHLKSIADLLMPKIFPKRDEAQIYPEFTDPVPVEVTEADEVDHEEVDGVVESRPDSSTISGIFGETTELDISMENVYRSGHLLGRNMEFKEGVSSWRNQERRIGKDYLEGTISSSIYAPIDERVSLHESLAALFSRLFRTLKNGTVDGNRELLDDFEFGNSLEDDLCQKWLDCKDKLEEAFLGPLVALPGCPCQYPSNIFYDDKIWDERHRRHFRWRDVSGDSERLDVYKPGASYCVRSLVAQGSGSAAAQHCCYDRRRRLLTRGSGAGTPNFVSPEVSVLLHERIDVLPWRLCKGDFSRFNKVRPPNNDNRCKANPDDEEYQRQMMNTKYY